MKRGLIYLVAAVIVVAGLAAAVPPLRQRARQIAADLKIISADTGDVMSSATYQRFAARRQAVEAMRADLRRLADIEAAFIRDSGRPSTNLLPPYHFAASPGVIGPTIRIERNGWSAMMSNTRMTWIVLDYQKMATGGYMDEVERCLHAAKR